MKTDCLLCRAEKRTRWHYEDDEFYVCDCATCGAPMAVVRAHTLAVGEGLRLRAVAKLAEVANRLYGPGLWRADFWMRTVKDHWHCHARPVGREP